jgi:peptidoglycan/xylan/chitin deacetylase (PgdA/CDA1 family)
VDPTFLLTFDTELMWGSFDRLSEERFVARYPDIRGTIEAILDELDRYDIPATWAVVGHLFLDRCERGPDGFAHPELARATRSTSAEDRLRVDPCTDHRSAPQWYGPDIVDAILGARTHHEIGSHSFSHPIFDDPSVTAEVAAAELSACARVARDRGIELRSFVFPRNHEGHHEVLRDHGFIAFRSLDPTWYRRVPRTMARLAHLADQAVGATPVVSQPSERVPGLWEIPGSMLLLHRVGARKLVPMSARVDKAKRGVRAAIAQSAGFHLWTHPMNLASDRPAMLGGLRAILRDVADLREEGRINIATMAEVAKLAESERTIGAPPGAGAAGLTEPQ